MRLQAMNSMERALKPQLLSFPATFSPNHLGLVLSLGPLARLWGLWREMGPD